MSIFKKRAREEPIMTGNAEADLEAVMKKYDRESNTRVWEGTPRYVVRGILAAFSLFAI